MRSANQKTGIAIFTEPVPRTLEFASIEALLLAVGADKVEGKGSRVRFHKGGQQIIFHRPHPETEAKRYRIKYARDFLVSIGVKS
ncbi:MAG: type II toxin-antitoxin system HicA family toxin [Alphaproteobacteria bacterium]|nr:MAG: type II toxin-antitoxin system HicA family toxin [Alphaproteobacteria bacterium]